MVLAAILLDQSSKRELEALKPVGDIEQVWVDHNVFEGDLKGMIIHVRFSVKNYWGTQCSVNAYFYHESGERLNGFNDDYNIDGQVAMKKDFVPTYKDYTFNDFKLFMPYRELHLSTGRYNLKFDIHLLTRSGEVIDKSEYILMSGHFM